jgi:hypothetical protein
MTCLHVATRGSVVTRNLPRHPHARIIPSNLALSHLILIPRHTKVPRLTRLNTNSHRRLRTRASHLAILRLKFLGPAVVNPITTSPGKSPARLLLAVLVVSYLANGVHAVFSTMRPHDAEMPQGERIGAGITARCSARRSMVEPGPWIRWQRPHEMGFKCLLSLNSDTKTL